MMPSAMEDFFVEFLPLTSCSVIVCRSSTDPTPLVTLLTRTRIDPLATRSKGLVDQDRLRLNLAFDSAF
jgi:hypothetical protein